MSLLLTVAIVLLGVRTHGCNAVAVCPLSHRRLCPRVSIRGYIDIIYLAHPLTMCCAAQVGLKNNINYCFHVDCLGTYQQFGGTTPLVVGHSDWLTAILIPFLRIFAGTGSIPVYSSGIFAHLCAPSPSEQFRGCCASSNGPPLTESVSTTNPFQYLVLKNPKHPLNWIRVLGNTTPFATNEFPTGIPIIPLNPLFVGRYVVRLGALLPLASGSWLFGILASRLGPSS